MSDVSRPGLLRRLFGRVSRSTQQAEIMALLEQMLLEQRRDAAWRSIFRRQLNALVRRQALDGSALTHPYSLRAKAFRLRSQNDEDGITLTLLEAAGIARRRFVEIGCGSSGGNSAILAFECGWSGLMVDASERKIATLRRELAWNPGVSVVRRRVTPERFNHLLRDHDCVGDLDFMSIDVDSVDYWLLDALTVCSPRVLVMEYNAYFGSERAVTLPSSGIPEGRLPDGYFGASLAALEKKAREKGYRLVFCEDSGVNAFFLRHDVAPAFRGLTPIDAYRPPLARQGVEGPEDIFALIAAQRLPLIQV